MYYIDDFGFSFSGFGNALSFKTIDDAEIIEVEKFVRENGAEFLSMDSGKNENDFFGEVLKKNPSRFKFRPGDIKLIKQIVKHVKNIIDGGGNNKGIEYFKIAPQESTIVIGKQSENSVQIENIQNKTTTHFFLNKLLSAADRNSKREKGGFRYDWDVKLYAAYLRILIGPFSYETLQRNLMHSLPSLPSTNRYINHLVAILLKA